MSCAFAQAFICGDKEKMSHKIVEQYFQQLEQKSTKRTSTNTSESPFPGHQHQT